MSDENGSARDTLVEAISWAEDIDTGRWGYERAAAMLDGYVERIVAERLAAIEAERDRLIGLLAACPQNQPGHSCCDCPTPAEERLAAVEALLNEHKIDAVPTDAGGRDE